jgi:PKD repeat protein
MEKEEIRSRECLLFNVLLALIVLYSTSVFGATIRVPTDYPTIQAGIDAAVDGDIVIVADGTYVGPGNKDLDFNGKAITVQSENGPESCVIDLQGNGRGFYFHSGETKSSVLSGFTITNGMADYGGGIRCSSEPTITNCKIIGNTAERSGGGIFCAVRSCTITNCMIINNTAILGGGVYISHARIQITNCTITGNRATSQGGGMYVNDSAANITNSILWGDSPSEVLIEIGINWEHPTIRYCDIEGDDVTDTTIIHLDPLFVDVSDPNPAKWDLHLLPSSPCIDMGSNAAPGLPSTDFEGDPRKIDGDGDGTAIADMGADEYSGDSPPPVAAFIASPTRGTAPLTVQFTDQSTGEITSRNWDFGDNDTSTDKNPSHTYNNVGNYTVSLTVHGPKGSHTETKVDYIKVRSGVISAMPWIPLLLLQESPPASWIIMMSEDFEAVFPSGSWRFYGDPTWDADDYRPYNGSKSAWCARGGSRGLVPATNDYLNNMNAWMISGPFDISDASDAELSFHLWLEIEENFDYFMWLASTDGTNFFGYKTDRSTNAWVEKKLDLKTVPTLGNLCGESQVWIGFKFDSDSSVTYKGAFVDDIFLRKKK